MANGSKKVQCVLWLEKFVSVIQVRREYHRPYENIIRRWDRQLKGKGSQLDTQRSGIPYVGDESVENIRNNFIRSPKKSVCKYSRE
jgi:hypothetical protein